MEVSCLEEEPAELAPQLGVLRTKRVTLSGLSDVAFSSADAALLLYPVTPPRFHTGAGPVRIFVSRKTVAAAGVGQLRGICDQLPGDPLDGAKFLRGHRFLPD